MKYGNLSYVAADSTEIRTDYITVSYMAVKYRHCSYFEFIGDVTL
jgi:hypothetical protein